MAELLAISASLFWGLSYVLTRVGLRGSNPFTAVLITSICSLSVSLLISLFAVPLEVFLHLEILYFIAAGFLGPCISRFLLYVGIDRVGASIAAPLSEIKPLFAAIAAVLILGERLFTSIALGTILIVLGVVTISLEESGGLIEKRWSKRDLIFPILAGIGFGVVHVLRKMGLNGVPEPIVGVTMQNASALAFFPMLFLAQRGQQKMLITDKAAWIFFTLTGLSMTIAQLCNFSALSLGQVVIVSPLSSLSPFFVLLLVRIFLRGVEKVTWKIVLGVILTVGGTGLLTLL
jgi:DME family drug/metabolite transporter